MYDLQLEKAVEQIQQAKAKRVLIQLPDGLKAKAKEIVDELQKQTNAKIVIWSGTAYGACDTPQGVEGMGFDLIIHFGHSKWVH